MTEWDIFKTKGLHLMHLNINSLLPKIDKLRYIARISDAAVTGVSDSKLDKSVTDSEILIDNYDLKLICVVTEMETEVGLHAILETT